MLAASSFGVRRLPGRALFVLLLGVMAAAPVLAGTHALLTVTDNSADTTVPVTDLLMVTITTDAVQGGNDATATLVSVGGTVAPADVASVSVYYQALLVATVTNPNPLTDINISLPGNQKGNQDWTYFLSLNGSAAGKTFNLTVTSITGTDDANLAFTTATRNATGAANNPPTASAGDITGQDDPQYAGVEYQVTSVYSDADGAADLAELHLRLDHDTATDVEFSVTQGAAASGSATVVSGAAFLIGTPTYSKSEGSPTASDITVTWTYTLDWDWVESTLIEYGVRATDDQAADSGFSNTNIDILYENDLDYSGTLSVSGAVNGVVVCGADWVQGLESLTWTGLTAVYQGSGLSPADGDFDLRITDDDTGMWTQLTGAALNLGSTSDSATDTSDIHDVDIVNIPAGGSDVSAVTCEIKVDAGAPETLAGVAAGSPTPASITVSWTAYGGGDTGAVGDSGFQTYRVYYDTAPGVTTADPVWDSTDDPALATSTTSSTTINGLASNTPYYFRVVGRDQAENEGSVPAAPEVSDTTQPAAGDNLSVAENTPIRALDPAAGETGLVMQRFKVESDTSGDGAIELTSLRVDEQGTAQTGDIATVSVYIDVDLGFDGAVLIGSASFGADPQDVALTGGTVDDRTITNPGAKYLWIVYDLAGAATPGRTLQSRVTQIEVAGPDSGLTGLTLDSNLLTIVTAALDKTTVVGSAAFVSACSTPSATNPTGQITVIGRFTGDANDDGSMAVVWDTDNNPGVGGTVACGAVSGASPRQCLVTGLQASSDAGSNYWIEVTFADGDTVDGAANPETLGGGTGFNIPDCAGGDTAAPTVLILSPWRDAVIGGTERVRVQVYEDSADGSGLAAADPVQWAVDGGALSATGVTDNTLPTGNYDCGTDCKIYEFDLDTTTVNGGLTDDRHRLILQVTDAASPANVARVETAFRVRNLGTTPGGSGQLLRRTPGARLCLDCHDLPTHSSQSTGTEYGNWAMACNDCHTPHGTTNVFLVRQEVRTPNSGRLDVRFEKAKTDPGAGAVNDSTTLGQASYANEDADADTGTLPAHGPCQVCHTKTQSDGVERWRNTPAGGNNDNHYDFGRPTQACTNCHTHTTGFSPVGGGACSGCHFGSQSPAVKQGRRDVQVDFTRQSHHIQVGGGSGNPGELTDHDCVVCHAEGTVNAQGETETTADYHNDNDCSGSPCIDLKDVDNWQDDNPGASPVFRYDKQDLIDRLSGGVAGDTPGNWGSGDINWEDETADNLDPFCLSCHDFNGAVASYSKEDNGASGFYGSALDPFGDDGTPGDGIVITNTYDLLDRTRVVDVNSMVTGGSDLDGDGRNDPPDGLYARHAIRANLAGTTGAPSRYGANNIPSANWTSTTWNDRAVMGCADCHTVDGANAAAGNAHGSPSEYLLKDAFGKANEGTFDNYNATAQTGGYVCWRCHPQGVYSDQNPAHSGSTSNFEDTVLETGTARITAAAKSYGTIFGMACMSCHGSAPASEGTFQNPATPEGPEKGFGRIHGTSQIFGTGLNGNVGTREAYRFTNGGGLRYYDPGTWSTAGATCYTLNGDTDQWSGCEQHSKANGQGFTRPFTRPRDY